MIHRAFRRAGALDLAMLAVAVAAVLAYGAVHVAVAMIGNGGIG